MEKDLIQKLKNVDVDKLKVFSLEGISGYARVIDIHDGDTLKCVMEINGFGFCLLNIRLAGIDTPEINSKNTDEKNVANLSRNRLMELCAETDNIVYVRLLGEGMYGRILGDVIPLKNIPNNFHPDSIKLDEEFSNLDSSELNTFSKILIDEHLAYPYSGKAKRNTFESVKHFYRKFLKK